MKKSIILLILLFSSTLYPFFDEIEDLIEDSLEGLFQIVGIVAMIFIVVFFIKKFINKDYQYKETKNHKYNIEEDKE